MATRKRQDSTPPTTTPPGSSGATTAMEDLTVAQSQQTDDDVVTYTPGQRLIVDNGKWKIYDVYVEGVSLVQNYQTQFRDLFETESAAQVIDRLKQKIEEQKHQNETSG